MSDFSPEAMKALHFAREEAQLLHATCLDSEHLLLGVLRESQEQDTHVLHNVDLIHARALSSRLSAGGESPSSGSHIACPTPEVRRIWHGAADEAQKLKQKVAIHHLLLALTLRPECNGYQLLRQLDLNLDELRRQLLQGYNDDAELRVAEPQAPRFDKFTQRARLVLYRAQEEATIFHHSYVDLEHLFLGLLCAGEGAAMSVLRMSGVDLDALEQTFVRQLCSQKQSISHLTPRAKRVIQLAVDEAFHFHHDYLGTEHFLLGMLRESEGRKEDLLTRLGLKPKSELQAENLFVSSGLNAEKVRRWTYLVLAGGATDDPIYM